ncbi:MAG: hypothetical protein EBU07_18540 [Betaproteobacteria bacterium]|nr:hypothetical protein [Betaproteobacteria bacterium]
MFRLFRVRGFAAFISMVFLNAFVDLGHKIVIQNTVFRVYDGTTQVTLTAILNGLILLPFVFLFTGSGYLSDRYAKPQVMKLAAAAAVVLTALITLFYALGWFWCAFGMTLLLGVQAAIYSPAKLGYIKELVQKAVEAERDRNILILERLHERSGGQHNQYLYAAKVLKGEV